VGAYCRSYTPLFLHDWRDQPGQPKIAGKIPKPQK
jgi:hypothetical protein